MTTRTITVSGMTCNHCVGAVSEEIGALDGVTSVDVTLDSGKVRIDSDSPIDDAALAAAVDEAGYEIADLGTP